MIFDNEYNEKYVSRRVVKVVSSLNPKRIKYQNVGGDSPIA